MSDKEQRMELALAALTGENQDLREKIQKLENRLMNCLGEWLVEGTVWVSFKVQATCEEEAIDVAYEEIDAGFLVGTDIDIQKITRCG